MAVFNCKQCGAKLNLLGGEYILTCDYCGTKQTVQGNDVFELDRNFEVSDDDREILDAWFVATELMESMLMRSEFGSVIDVYDKTTEEYGRTASWKAVFCVVMANLQIRKPEDFATYDDYNALSADDFWDVLKTLFAKESDDSEEKKYIFSIDEKVRLNSKIKAVVDIRDLLKTGSTKDLLKASELVHTTVLRDNEVVMLMEQIVSAIYDLGKHEFDRENYKDAALFFGKCLKYKDALKYYETSTNKLNGSDVLEFEAENQELDAQLIQLQKD
ncbi:MAG: hypothetical protein MJ248_00600, partial [Bacilli bacterium]|nr:hypothetical protein [Bacilli bacterium]